MPSPHERAGARRQTWYALGRRGVRAVMSSCAIVVGDRGAADIRAPYRQASGGVGWDSALRPTLELQAACRTTTNHRARGLRQSDNGTLATTQSLRLVGRGTNLSRSRSMRSNGGSRAGSRQTDPGRETADRRSTSIRVPSSGLGVRAELSTARGEVGVAPRRRCPAGMGQTREPMPSVGRPTRRRVAGGYSTSGLRRSAAQAQFGDRGSGGAARSLATWPRERARRATDRRAAPRRTQRGAQGAGAERPPRRILGRAGRHQPPWIALSRLALAHAQRTLSALPRRARCGCRQCRTSTGAPARRRDQCQCHAGARWVGYADRVRSRLTTPRNVALWQGPCPIPGVASLPAAGQYPTPKPRLERQPWGVN